jgi:hypothetical protein
MFSSNKSTREEGAAAEKTAMSSGRHARRATRPVATVFMSKSKIEKGFTANSLATICLLLIIYLSFIYSISKPKKYFLRKLSTATFFLCGWCVW